MLLDKFYQIPRDEIARIKWDGDPLYYDLQLYQLGEGRDDEFFAVNPDFEGNDVLLFIDKIPKTRKCVVFTSNGKWVLKLFKQGWYPYHGYESVEIEVPKLVWSRNSEIDNRMTFEADPRVEYKLDFWDKDYELYWIMDPRFYPYEGEKWVFRAQALGTKPKGTKFMGTVTPQVKMYLNKDVDFLDLDANELYPSFYELDNECVIILDKAFTANETVEIATVKPVYKKPLGRKIVGVVSPDVNIEVNPKLKNINFDISDAEIYFEDLDKEHIWLLDEKYLGPEDREIWAIKMKATRRSKGKKIVGFIEPEFEIEVNPELPELDFDIDYQIPWYDLKYEHMWMLHPKHTRTAPENIWLAKVRAADYPEGTKIVGNLELNGELEINGDVTVPFEIPDEFAVQYHDLAYRHTWISEENGESIWLAKLTYVEEPVGDKQIDITGKMNPDLLDVIFISYDEPNAKKNWLRVYKAAPWAQRVEGVEGILKAHKEAAKLARTEMFFVVDGDAELFVDWRFDFKPSIFDRDCTYIWSAKNPLADLTYGYGGVKLFSREKLLKLKKWRTLDMTTSVTEKVKIMSEISNWTNFNTDEYSTWRSVFRECVKLAFNNYRHPDNPEHQIRLNKWFQVDQTQEFGTIASRAAFEAVEFVKENSYNMDALIKINDRNWLKEKFESRN